MRVPTGLIHPEHNDRKAPFRAAHKTLQHVINIKFYRKINFYQKAIVHKELKKFNCFQLKLNGLMEA